MGLAADGAGYDDGAINKHTMRKADSGAIIRSSSGKAWGMMVTDGLPGDYVLTDFRTGLYSAYEWVDTQQFGRISKVPLNVFGR